MTTVEQQINTRTNEIRRTLVSDPEAYVESIGKEDGNNLPAIVDNPEAGTTALRLVMGATEAMPFRALSYVDSLLRVARLIPASQIQIVHANNLGNHVNGISLANSNEQARLLAEEVEAHLAQFPDLESRVLHAIDTDIDTDRYTDLVRSTFDRDTEIATRLLAKGSKHGGDSVSYVAAHYAFQDTDDLRLDPITQGAPDQVSADRIVSVGCGQERTFYRARMGMRALLQSDITTAQVFTKHTTPPYYTARGGEPSLDEGASLTTLDSIGDPAARRDIAHFLTINNEGVQ
jgi:hypothetical protein